MPTPAEFVDHSGQATHREITDPQLKPRSVDEQLTVVTTNNRLSVPNDTQKFADPAEELNKQIFRSLSGFWP